MRNFDFSSKKILWAGIVFVVLSIIGSPFLHYFKFATMSIDDIEKQSGTLSGVLVIKKAGFRQVGFCVESEIQVKTHVCLDSNSPVIYLPQGQVGRQATARVFNRGVVAFQVEGNDVLLLEDMQQTARIRLIGVVVVFLIGAILIFLYLVRSYRKNHSG